jgi:hypothetical protein
VSDLHQNPHVSATNERQQGFEEGLEAAAQVADQYAQESGYAFEIAQEIRALKAQKAPH